MEQKIIVVGATGNLGMRVVKALLERGANVTVVVRQSSSAPKLDELRLRGARTTVANFDSIEHLASHFVGASCVVSTLLGLRNIMVETQTNVLNAAIKAGVPRFIPSDYCSDFRTVEPGQNRNFDLHREFQLRIDASDIQATSIFNGAFMDLLLGQAPIIQYKFKRVLYWENADQLLDFTTMDDTAAFTAAAAMDKDTPRYSKIVGEQISARSIAETMTLLTGSKYRLLRAGSVNSLRLMSNVIKSLTPPTNDPFPIWQGMQYSCSMFDGSGKLDPVDNDRYPDIRWTRLGEFLSETKLRAKE